MQLLQSRNHPSSSFILRRRRPAAEVSQTGHRGADGAKGGQPLALHVRPRRAPIVQRRPQPLADVPEVGLLVDRQSGGHVPVEQIQLLVQGQRLLQRIECGLKKGGGDGFKLFFNF